MRCKKFKKKVRYFQLKRKDITSIMSKWRESHVPLPFGTVGFEESLQEV